MLDMVLFLLSWLPDSILLTVFYSLAGLGLLLVCISWFITIIPFINRYRFPIQVVGVAALTIGAYMTGGYGVQMMWKKRVEEMEAKVKVAEEQSKQQNVVIKEKIVYKTKLVEKKTVEYVDRVKEIAKEVDAQCKVDPRIVEVINKAAEDPTK